MPERPATVRAVNRLLARVRQEGARGRLLHLAFVLRAAGESPVREHLAGAGGQPSRGKRN